MRSLALVVLFASAAYLFLLGLAALLDRSKAFKFLSQFAQTRRSNVIETSCRLVAGLAFIKLAPELPASSLFTLFGVMLAVTAIALLVFESAHQRFAERVMPRIERTVPFIGLVSLAVGVGLIILLLPLQSFVQSPY
jgi:hypothetical protein